MTEIEFLAAVSYFRENETLLENREPLHRLQRDFLERHLLNWLPAATGELEVLNPPLSLRYFAYFPPISVKPRGSFPLMN